MNFEQIMPAIALILVLILVLPGFISSNSNLKVFLKKYIYLGYNCFGCCDSSIFHLTNEKNKFSYFWVHGTYGTADNKICKV